MTATGPARGAWLAILTVNAILAVGAAFVLVPWLIVLVAVLAGLGLRSVDPALVDAGLASWVVVAVAETALYAAVAASVNLLVVRRMRLKGHPWVLLAATVTLVVGIPLAVFMTPGLW